MDGFSYPASEVGSEKLGFRGEVHKKFSNQVETKYLHGAEESFKILWKSMSYSR